jgi:hypothetical protein
MSRPPTRRTRWRSRLARIRGRRACLVCGCATSRRRSPGFPSGRFGEGPRRSRRRRPISCGNRPFHKPGAGCAAYPRCWRSRRTAISPSYPIEQTPTAGCIRSSTPTTDAHAIPAALPSPARAIVLARANAALSELVRCESLGSADHALGSSRICEGAALRGFFCNARRSELSTLGFAGPCGHRDPGTCCGIAIANRTGAFPESVSR